MQTGPFFISRTSEQRWVNYTSRNYTIDLGIHPCIFQVPQKLKDEKPEAYTPRALGLGPYHHLRPELQEMESQKRASVKAFLGIPDLKKLPLKLDPKSGQRNSPSIILPHYDTYPDLDGKTLVWILVIDVIFLLQYLKEQKNWEDRRMVAELMILENQIPMVLLEDIRKALKVTFPDVLDAVLLDQFNRFCKQQSPLKLCKYPERIDAAFGDKKHLLHFLYVLIVENFKAEKPSAQQIEQQAPRRNPLVGLGMKENLLQAVHETTDSARNLRQKVISTIVANGLKISDPIVFMSKLIKQFEKASDQKHNSDKNLHHRLADKIDVPSVSELYHIASINFACADGGIRNILFDDSKNTLYLPEIKLGETSEVLLRNLVAYEAASKPSGSILELAEYVDLMCGIIKTKSDVKLLRQFGIIKGNLTDEQIVRIFNGIDKSTQIPPEQSEIQRVVQKLSKLFLQETSYPYSDEENQNQLANKIEVPSASKLHEIAKIKYACRKGGERNILFDEKKTTLYLPEIKLGNTSEEAEKNLAAYEPEYVDFMCEIIEYEYDAKFLKKDGIIKGNLTEEQIVNVFKEIGKSIQWPNEPSVVQKIVQQLSKKFMNLRVVKLHKVLKNISAGYKSFVTQISPAIVILLFFMQHVEYQITSSPSFGLDDSEAKLMMPRKFLGYDRNLM